jgi:O-antigen ligase
LKEIHPWGPHQAHNGYIEIWLHLGLVGLLLFVLVIRQGLQGVSLLFQKDFEYGRFRLILLLIILLHNYSEAGFPRPTHLVWFVFLLAAVNLKPVQAISAEKVPTPADAAWQFWMHKKLNVRQGTYSRNSRIMYNRSTKLTPRLPVGKETWEQRT